MTNKEAKSRIKINKLLEDAGWRFLDCEAGTANILVENNVKLTQKSFNELGEDFEKSKNGFIDFLLLDEKGFPLIVLEAKSEDKNPLVGKEQARKYAKAQNCRFVILSNGNLHYFWDLQQGNPYVITKFPKQDSVRGYKEYSVNSGDIVISLTRSIISSGLKVCTVPDEYCGALVNQRVAAIKGIEKLSNIKYIFYYLRSPKAYEFVENKSRSLMQPNLSIKDLKTFSIQLPSMKIQNTIVKEIDEELNIIEANKKLIAIFEQKIKNKIAGIWGE